LLSGTLGFGFGLLTFEERFLREGGEFGRDIWESLGLFVRHRERAA
jgi:hypothetical protein